MSDSNGDASLPTGAEMRARAKSESEIALDTQLLNDNICAALGASERLHWAARKKLQQQGLAPAATSGGGLTEDDLHQLAVGLFGWLGPILKDIEQRLTQIETKKGITGVAKRLAELEITAVKYQGVWEAEKVYSAGTLITHQGGLWHCEDTNMGVRPGAGSSTWTLANKSRR